MDLKANVQDNLLMETETTTAALDDLNEKFLPSIHLQKKGDHNSTGDLEKNAMESRNIGMSDMEMENKANNSKIFSESTQRCLQDEKKSNTESKPETFTEISVGELNKMTRYDFLRLQKKLYLLERDAENEREVMKTVNSSGEGVPGVLSHLEVVSVTSTRFGRICITFASYAHQTLPPHGLRKGDNVSIYSGGPMCRQEDHCRDGVVLDISNQDVHITIDEAYEFQESSSYSVKHFPSLENIKRILKALKCMAEVQGPSYHLSAVLFGESDPMPPLLRLPPKLTSSNSSNQLIFFNKTLDQSQQEAVDFVVKQQDLAVVHGPPGTGKTTTLIEIIRQHVKMGLKVLALAPSNLGVDNLVERLDIVGIRVVRIGHPARTTPATQRHTIDALMHNYEGREIVKDIQNEINTLTRRLDFIYGKDRHSTYKELGQLRKELNERQERMVRDLIQGADVVLCTLMSAHTSNAMRYLKKDHFGLTVIDECSQGTEASCYLSVLRSPKLVLAGDHQQLPPTVLSPEASALLISLMERVIDLHGSKIVKMLTVQYRMHVDIMSWSSAALYNNQLIAHESVSQHLLKDLPHVSNNEYTGVPLLLVDTSSCPGFEESIDESITASSRSNEGEASMVLALVQKMIAAGLSPQQVAVISPYSRQVKLVRSLIQVDYPEVEVQTVDGFQGREKEAVILTLVRSNTKGEIGFLAEDRRLNVAVTRARRHLSVVCDTQTLQQHSFLKTFVEYMLTNARVVRAEHMDEENCTQISADFRDLDLSDILKPQKPEVKPESKSEEQIAKEEFERTQIKTERIRKMLNTFIESSNKKYHFSAKLSSFERMIVHEAAQSMGLWHYSEGLNKKRHVVVSKEPVAEAQVVAVSDVKSPLDNEVKCSRDEEAPIYNVPQSEANDLCSEAAIVEKQAPTERLTKHCTICGKDILKENFTLHRLACEKKENEAISLRNKKVQEEKQTSELTANKENSKSKRKKNESKMKSTSAKEVVTEEEDFDAVLSAFAASHKRCNLAGCSAASAGSLLLQSCNYCHSWYCLQHFIAEAHGCGHHARQHARATVVTTTCKNLACCRRW
ncbi:DNA-binding protein SMUBP-2 isoform X2 [Hyalella azteca]|uniref:DNA-binding protein SMUBP-2 isoform X2 n=1 Tax=Hyalella azteca TaxID=294128 RepID=A0A8B7PGB1_HYAAZ|nr:DNA-binding protein SMUBP-2 isoform X2 [Hyalella azteca]